MARTESIAFRRVLPRHSPWRWSVRRAAFWSALATVLTCGLLLDLFLLTDLLATQGHLRVTGAAVERLSELAGEPRPTAEQTVRHVFNGGLLPTVWWAREMPFGPLVAGLYRAIPTLQTNAGALVTLIAAALLIAVARHLLLGWSRGLCEKVALETVTRLRQSLHRQTLRLGPSDLEERRTSEALRLFTTEAKRVEEGLVQWLYRLSRFPFEFLALLALALTVQWRLALQCLIPLAGCWYLAQRAGERIRQRRRHAEDRASEELRLLAEGLRKARLVRGYGMETFEHEQFQKHLDRFRNELARAARQIRWSEWATWLVVSVTGAIVLLFIGSKVLNSPEAVSVAAAVLLTLTLGAMFVPLTRLWALPSISRDVALAADTIYRYLDRIPEVGQAVGARFLEPPSQSIRFESVTYALPGGRTVLDGVDLKLPAKQIHAIVSLDALEPRAVAYLLPRFIEPQSGRILYDGNDIAWATLESLRAETIYVGGQDPFFTGTVFENISCGSQEYKLQQVTEAAKLTHAHNFIVKLPQGYETVLGEHGELLDAGQAFRLGLARAVLRNPAVLIIEEPTDALDADTKSLLDDAYDRICRERTVIFLPARLSTVRRADQIVLLHRGRVEALGTHSSLVRSSPLYRHWEYIRFNEFRHEQPVSV